MTSCVHSNPPLLVRVQRHSERRFGLVLQGVYSGSTTYVDGVPNYAYPGVHLYNYKDNPNGVTMTQCVATPADPTDPTLAQWTKRTIIPQSQIPHGISQHFHDDSTAFQLHGKWWIFMGSAVCGGNETSGKQSSPNPHLILISSAPHPRLILTSPCHRLPLPRSVRFIGAWPRR